MQDQQLVLGLDLGSTNCVAASMRASDSDPTPIKLMKGSETFPSVVCLTLKDGAVEAVLCGEAALSTNEPKLREASIRGLSIEPVLRSYYFRR